MVPGTACIMTIIRVWYCRDLARDLNPRRIRNGDELAYLTLEKIMSLDRWELKCGNLKYHQVRQVTISRDREPQVRKVWSRIETNGHRDRSDYCSPPALAPPTESAPHDLPSTAVKIRYYLQQYVSGDARLVDDEDIARATSEPLQVLWPDENSDLARALSATIERSFEFILTTLELTTEVAWRPSHTDRFSWDNEVFYRETGFDTLTSGRFEMVVVRNKLGHWTTDNESLSAVLSLWHYSKQEFEDNPQHCRLIARYSDQGVFDKDRSHIYQLWLGSRKYVTFRLVESDWTLELQDSYPGGCGGPNGQRGPTPHLTA
jgi:hypothetical protein